MASASHSGKCRRPILWPPQRRDAFFTCSAPSSGGIRRHVRYLAAHPPEGFVTAGVRGPADLTEYFEGLGFRRLGRKPLRGAPTGPDVDPRPRADRRVRAILSTVAPGSPPVVVTVHTCVRADAARGDAGSRPARRAARDVAALEQ